MSQRSTYSGGNDPYSALVGAGGGGGGGVGGGSAGGGDDNQSVKSNEKMYGHSRVSHMGNKFFKIK